MHDDHALAAAAAFTFPALPLAHALVADVLGIGVRIESDDHALAAAAADVFPAGPSRAAVTVLLRRAAPHDVPPIDSPLRHVDEGGRRMFAGAGCTGRVEFDAHRAHAWLSPELVRQPSHWREVIHAFVLSLVTRLDRQPFHAAAVGRADAAVLLAAPGGTGKSTLAYAAHSAGMRVLSDDAVYIQLLPQPCIWALGHAIHLAPDAAAVFPELAGLQPVLRSSSKRKLAIPIPTPSQPAARWTLCLLERPASAPIPSLSRLDADRAVAELADTLTPGFDAFRETMLPALRVLARSGAWRLVLSSDPRAALPLLASLLDQAGHR